MSEEGARREGLSSPRRGAGRGFGRKASVVGIWRAVDSTFGGRRKESDGVWPSKDGVVRGGSGGEADGAGRNEDGIFVNKRHGSRTRKRLMAVHQSEQPLCVCFYCRLPNTSPRPNPVMMTSSCLNTWLGNGYFRRDCSPPSRRRATRCAQ